MTSRKDRECKMREIVCKTVSVSKELEALSKEHEIILSKLGTPESNGMYNEPAG